MRRIASVTIALALMAAACGAPGPGDAGPITTSTTVPSPPTSTTTTTQPTPTTTTTTIPTAVDPGFSEDNTALRLYFFGPDPTGDQMPTLISVYREVPRTTAVADAAMRELLSGPNGEETAAGMTSEIPGDTLLLGVTVSDGLATVDLSREFEAGGGTASMTGRLAQVVFTLTQFPTVDRVTFELDGVAVTVFSGEGLLLEEPSTRDDFTIIDVVPFVFVETPAWGGPAGNPIRITGLSNTFEANVQYAVFDADGNELASGFTTALCGNGCWGGFEATLAYDVDQPQWGILRGFETSAKDGSPQYIRDHRVWLTPSS